MSWLHGIAEARIRDAIDRGLFDDLPGKGKPLELEDLSRVPEELRSSYLLCKNAGILPEELELHRDRLQLRDLIAACTDEGERTALRRELSLKTLRLETLMSRLGSSPAWSQYGDAVRTRVAGS